ncbi:hypothetical protein K443DRAFT_133454 [Laccaria amethystina LaAM-08-1]|uniref:PhoD-like phosphatase metallophosphatase domain-containing protein n=1 Tax=Laccaria amethystina LaAM-08-1 TaxID=1095629 RepID=A0A0C9XQV5_9AGAR|nr:hypothetical protein K443DRAFT_133454 [Laccaria amethystina LaAM-08-1]
MSMNTWREDRQQMQPNSTMLITLAFMHLTSLTGLTFTYSVASGDPFDSSVIIWTRAVPKSLDGTTLILDQCLPACVSYRVYTSSMLSGKPVSSDEAFTSYDVDWTVKVDGTGLKPYLFQFADCTNVQTVSPVGTTRTIATAAKHVNGGEPLTFAVISIWLNQYRTDASLVVAHAKAPWITDDHEVADNAWKAGSANSNDSASGCTWSPSGACFTDRNDKLRIWRNFKIGKLLDLTVLDTRVYDRDLTDVYYITVVNTIAAFPNCSIMGLAQEKWFYDTISHSQARGCVTENAVYSQQIVFSQLNFGGFFDLNTIKKTVILSGDSHANWVSDLAHPNDTITYSPKTGAGSIGQSAFGAGITPAAADNISQQLAAMNSDLQWSEASFRGFFTLTIDSETLNATYYAMNNISFANLDGFASVNFVVRNRENKLLRPVAGGIVKAKDV